MILFFNVKIVGSCVWGRGVKKRGRVIILVLRNGAKKATALLTFFNSEGGGWEKRERGKKPLILFFNAKIVGSVFGEEG